MQRVTRSWKVYRDGDCDLIKFPYSCYTAGIHPSSKCSARNWIWVFPALFLKWSYWRNCYRDKYVCSGKNAEGDSTNKILIVALVEGSFGRRNEGVLWCNTEQGSEFVGAISWLFYWRWARPNPILQGCFLSSPFSPNILDASFNSSCCTSRKCAYPMEQGGEC